MTTDLSDILDDEELAAAAQWERDPAWDEPCTNPSHLRRILPDGTTTVLSVPGGSLHQLRSVCPSCSVRYQAQVTRTLRKGAPDVPTAEEVAQGARMPGAVLWTLTAPSFGPVHRTGRTLMHGKQMQACERSCIGAPLDPSRYGYVHQAIWSYTLPDLVKATRSHIDRLGEDLRDAGDHFQLRGNVELQERLAPHLHLIATAADDPERAPKYDGLIRDREANRFKLDPDAIKDKAATYLREYNNSRKCLDQRPTGLLAQANALLSVLRKGEGVLRGFSHAEINAYAPDKLSSEYLARLEVPLFVKKEKGQRGWWWARPLKKRQEITSTKLADYMESRWSNPETSTPADLLTWVGSSAHLARRDQLGLPVATADNLNVPDTITWGDENDYSPKIFAAPDDDDPGKTFAEARSYIGKATGYVAKDAGGKDGDPLPEGKRRTHENRMRKEAAAVLIDSDLTKTLRRWIELRTEQIRDELQDIDNRIYQLKHVLASASAGFSQYWTQLYGELVEYLNTRTALQNSLTAFESVVIPAMSWTVFDSLTRFDVLGLDEINSWIEAVQRNASEEVGNQYGAWVRIGRITENELMSRMRSARQTAFARSVINQLEAVGVVSAGFMSDIPEEWLQRLDQSIRLRLRRIVTFFGQTGNIVYGSRWKTSFASDRRDSQQWRNEQLEEQGLMLDPQLAVARYEFIAVPTPEELAEAERNTGPPTIPIL